MAKKLNSAGEMQNYNTETGEYTKDSSGSSKKEEIIKKNYPVNESVEEKPIKQFASFGKSSFNSANSGYDGYSMSNRAREAYDKGEKPYSKWTKEDIIDSLPEEYREEFNKLPLKDLKSIFLYVSSWHHTGKYFNKTDFWSINDDIDYEKELAKFYKRKEEEKVDKITEKKFKTLSDEEKQKVYDDFNKKRYEAVKEDLELRKKADLEWLKQGIESKRRTQNEVDFILECAKNSPYKIVKSKKGDFYSSWQTLRHVKKPELESAPSWFEKMRVDTWEIEGGIYGGYERSESGNLYPKGKKPSRQEYEKGLEHFFTKGDKMFSEKLDKVMTWNGKEWE